MSRSKIKRRTKRVRPAEPRGAAGIPAYAVSRAALPSPAFDALPQEVRTQVEALRVVAPATRRVHRLLHPGPLRRLLRRRN